jgi:hypothetical protein
MMATASAWWSRIQARRCRWAGKDPLYGGTKAREVGQAGSKAVATSADFPGAIPDQLVSTADYVAAHPAEVQATGGGVIGRPPGL